MSLLQTKHCHTFNDKTGSRSKHTNIKFYSSKCHLFLPVLVYIICVILKKNLAASKSLRLKNA